MVDAGPLIVAAQHLQAGKMFQLASYVFLIYDHLITFSIEVEQVWIKPWSRGTVLFALNRYITPLQFLVILVAFHSKAWSENRLSLLLLVPTFQWLTQIPACEHFVRFEGGSTLALVAICEVMMMMRVYALWGRDNRILALLVFFWIAQVVGSALALTFSERVPLPPGFVGCILTGKNNLLVPIWVMPLITNTVIFALTLLRSGRYLTYGTRMPMLQTLVRDGTLYFVVIFAANLLNTILFLSSTEDLKAIGASFSQIITSVMISRLVLNLRNLRGGHETEDTSGQYSGRPVVMETIPMRTLMDSNLPGDHGTNNSRTDVEWNMDMK